LNTGAAELFLSAACREPAWFLRAALTTFDSIKPAKNFQSKIKNTEKDLSLS